MRESGSVSLPAPFTDPSERLPCVVCALQAISIVGDEVFSFAMSLTPSATEGPGYTDTSKVDGRVKLNVGCIQVVYLHKFVMSLLVSLLSNLEQLAICIVLLITLCQKSIFFCVCFDGPLPNL